MVSTLEVIPDALRAKGFGGPHDEIAWDPDDAIEVAQWLNQTRRAVVSGNALGWFADGSVCDTLSSGDPNRRLVSRWDTRGAYSGRAVGGLLPVLPRQRGGRAAGPHQAE